MKLEQRDLQNVVEPKVGSKPGIVDDGAVLELRSRLKRKGNLRLTAVVVALILGLAFYAKWGRLGILAGAVLVLIAMVAPNARSFSAKRSNLS